MKYTLNKKFLKLSQPVSNKYHKHFLYSKQKYNKFINQFKHKTFKNKINKTTGSPHFIICHYSFFLSTFVLFLSS